MATKKQTKKKPRESKKQNTAKQAKPRKERKKLIVPESVAVKLFKIAGASRISKGARDELLNLIAKYGRDVAERAVKLSKHAKRKTVEKEDIKLALE